MQEHVENRKAKKGCKKVFFVQSGNSLFPEKVAKRNITLEKKRVI